MNNSKDLIIGVDPGKDGAISILHLSGDLVESKVMPLSGDFLDVVEIYNYLEEKLDRIKCVFLEEVHSIYGSSAKSNFTFGGVYWTTRTILILLDIPYELVQPKKWQQLMFDGIPELRKPDIIIKKGKNKGKTRKGKKDTKKMALLACNKIYPEAKLLRTERCTVPHDGIVDAILIAEYGRRKICH